jgi:hypothetical protein
MWVWAFFIQPGGCPPRQQMGSMNDMQFLIDQMVSDIFSQAVRLDDSRLHLFLNWLNAHSRQMKTITGADRQTWQQPQMDVEVLCKERLEESFKNGLRGWFESLPFPGLLWEHHLILDEIICWYALDPRRLIMILRSEAGQ